MLRLLGFILASTAAALAIAWLVGNPGTVTVFWLGYRVEISFVLLCLFVMLMAAAWFVLFSVIGGLANVKHAFSYERSLRRQQQGLTAVTKAFAALAVSDLRMAERMNQQAQKYLGRKPITLLLAAQLARVEGDERRTKLYLEEMLDSKETEFVAMRGLVENARQKGNIEEALRFAEKAKSAHKDHWSVTTLIDLYCRQHRWQEALQTVDGAVRNRRIGRDDAQHYRAVIYTLEAEKLHRGSEYTLATAFARKAYKLKPDFVPATVALARALIEMDEPQEAAKALLSGWKTVPHPAYASLYRELFRNEEAGKHQKRIEKFASYHPDAFSSRLMLAQSYIELERWAQAHTTLAEVLALHESATACHLMAKVQKEGFDDMEEANRWLLRAATSDLDPAWVCQACGHESSEWHGHCPQCHSFDSHQWQARQKLYIDAVQADSRN